MITGFNTDIERDGVVYHVQTEDKGLDSPLILSLVYSGGEILAAKRTPYEDLIAEGFTDQALAERLKRQHRLICAAINAGRIEELKQMSARKDAQAPAESSPAATPEDKEIESPPEPAVEAEFVIEPSAARPNADWHPPVEVVSAKASPAEVRDRQIVDEPVTAVTTALPAEDSAYTVYDSRRPSRPKKSAKRVEVLVLTLLDNQEFFAGQSARLRVLLQRRVGEGEKPISGVVLSVKVLGANFRPQIYSVKTERDGVAVVSIDFPPFSSGRAAVVIRAEAQGETAELRRVIHPAS